MSELLAGVGWLEVFAACGWAVAAGMLVLWSTSRAWARVLELHVNALWREREARYARQPLVAPAMPEAQAVALGVAAEHVRAGQLVALAPDRSDQLEAIASCDPPRACATHGRCWTHSHWDEPPPLDGARTIPLTGARAEASAARPRLEQLQDIADEYPPDTLRSRQTFGMSLPRWRSTELGDG